MTKLTALKLKIGKKCVPDDLSVWHVIYCHPCLCITLCSLLEMIINHRYAADGFGSGVIVPLIEYQSRNLNGINNYRPITPISIVSKLSEVNILYAA